MLPYLLYIMLVFFNLEMFHEHNYHHSHLSHNTQNIKPPNTHCIVALRRFNQSHQVGIRNVMLRSAHTPGIVAAVVFAYVDVTSTL